MLGDGGLWADWSMRGRIGGYCLGRGELYVSTSGRPWLLAIGCLAVYTAHGVVGGRLY